MIHVTKEVMKHTSRAAAAAAAAAAAVKLWTDLLNVLK